MAAPYLAPLARSSVYELISLAFLYPEIGRVAQLVQKSETTRAMALEAGLVDVAEVLVELGRHLHTVNDEELAAQYIDIFGHSISPDCAPYEGEYGQAHVFQKSQTLADLATFYHAFGVKVNPQLKDRLDHLSVEMEFMHLLTLKEAYSRLHYHGEEKTGLCQQAQRSFLAHHLSDWIGPFCNRLVCKTAEGGVYRLLAQLLDLFMEWEFETWNIRAPVNDLKPVAEQPDEDGDCSEPGLALIAGQ